MPATPSVEASPTQTPSKTPEPSPSTETPETPEVEKMPEYGDSDDYDNLQEGTQEFMTMSDGEFNALSPNERVKYVVSAGILAGISISEGAKNLGLSFSSQENNPYYAGGGSFMEASPEMIIGSSLWNSQASLGMTDGLWEGAGGKLDRDAFMRMLTTTFDQSDPVCNNMIQNVIEISNKPIHNGGAVTYSKDNSVLMREEAPCTAEYEGQEYPVRVIVMGQQKPESESITTPRRLYVMGIQGEDHSGRPVFMTRTISIQLL